MMHDAGGNWIGWGPGDVGATVADMKAFLKRKFTWVRESGLDSGPRYTGILDDPPLGRKPVDALTTMVMVVKQMQLNYGDLPVTGIMNAATQQRCGFYKPPAVAKPVLFTVHGTYQPDPMGPGLPADVARILASEGLCDWQPIGDYPAAPFPMWPSVLMGVASLERQCVRTDTNCIGGPYAPRPKWLLGYSQGAAVCSHFYKYSVTAGPLRWMHDTFVKSAQFGNPMCERGARPMESHGILPDRMVNTPPWWRDFSNPGDLYCDTGNTEKDENYTAVAQIVMGSNWWAGPDSIIRQVAELVFPLDANPLEEAWGAIEAIVGAGMFFGSGTAAHWYHGGLAVDFFRQ